MKILTLSNSEIYGPFTTIARNGDYYLADETRLNVEEGTVSDVSDDWINPYILVKEKNDYNEMQRQLREKDYKEFTDPMFFQVQRGAYTNDEWLARIADIKSKYPYKE